MLQLHYPPYTHPSQHDDALDLMVNRFMDDSGTQQPVQEGPAARYERPSGEWPRTLAVEEAEEAMGRARKEHEAFEKRMNAVLKKNRRLMFGGGH
ncbi:hypothetical protein G7Y79_00049g084910 [Physcia stellaris]|nr:hypothetical protein G7Y79_00049g084910 [Physcia stellaris]